MNPQGPIKAILLAAFLVISMAVQTSVAPADAGPRPLEARAPLQWLLMIYMAADNTLGENGEWGNAAVMDLEELESNFPSDGARALVLADLKGDHNTVLYDISNHPSKGLGSPTIPLSEVNSTWSDEVRSSDWQTLSDFIVYCLGSTDATNIMLVIWDHGSGWQAITTGGPTPPVRSVAQDVTDGGIMDLAEMRRALATADSAAGGLSMGILSFDACYMGTLEVYDQVSPWSRIFIAAEDEQPFYGFNYSFITLMGSQEPLGPEALSGRIVAQFSQEYSDPEWYPYSTISAADLAVLRDDLTGRFDQLAKELWGWMHELQVVGDGGLDRIIYRSEQVGFSQTDLGDLLRQMGAASLPGNLSDIANGTLASYDRMMIDEYHVPEGRNPYATGATVYTPPSNITYYNTIYDGSRGYLSLTEHTYWDEMLRERCAPQERLRVIPNVTALDPDQIRNDIVLTAVDPRPDPMVQLPGVLIEVGSASGGSTDPEGKLVLKDLGPGRYMITARSGMLRDRTEVKVLNTPPVMRYELDGERAVEGTVFAVDASGSFDPDGDAIVFQWDVRLPGGEVMTEPSDTYLEFICHQPGVVTIDLTISDGVESIEGAILVPVDNLDPVADLIVPHSVIEDEPFALDASGSTDTYPDNTTLMYSFDLDGSVLGDWSYSSIFEVSIGDRGHHEVGVTVRDDQGSVSTIRRNVEVFNDPPSVSIIGTGSVAEDQPFLWTAKGNDTPSDVNGLLYTWRLTEGWLVVWTGPSYEGRFSRSGTYNISVEVVDDDMFNDLAFKEIEVRNIGPEADFAAPQNALEGEVITLNGSLSSDTQHDLGSLIYEWDLYADGSIDLVGTEVQASFNVPGRHPIRLIVTDDDGSNDSIERSVEVINAPPRPSLSGRSAAIEDEVLRVMVEEGIDTPNDELSLSFIWTVDGNPVNVTEDAVDLSFDTQGIHTIMVEVRDDQGASGSDSFEVAIENMVPIAGIDRVPERVDEGDLLELSAMSTWDTVSDNGSLIFIWSLDGRIIQESTSRSAKVRIDGHGKHSIELTVKDDEGARSSSGPVWFEVTERTDPLPFVLIISSIAILGFIVAAYVMSRKVRGLPAPVDAMVPEATEASEEKGPEDGVSRAMEVPTPEGMAPPGEEKALDAPPELETPTIEEAPVPEEAPSDPFDPRLLDR